MPLERQDLEFYFEQLHGKVDGINDRLDVLNGKTNKNLTDIAILFDRADQAKQLALAGVNEAKSLAQSAVQDAKNAGRSNGSKWGAGLGTAFATAIMLIWQWINKN